MLLAIDVGNTETVIGLFSTTRATPPPAVTGPLRRDTRAGRPDPPLAAVDGGRPHARRARPAPPQLLDLDGLDIDDVVTGMAVTSSVPLVTAALRQMAGRWFEVPCVVLEPGVRSGMPILYDNPKEVGADRIANASRRLRPLRRARASWSTWARPPPSTPSPAAASTWAGPSPRASPSPWTPSSTTPPPCAGSSWSSPAASSASRRSSRSSPGALYGFAAQVDGMCRRIMDELGAPHGGGHRRPVRADRPVCRGHRARRAVAHPARAAAHLRAQLRAASSGGRSWLSR